MKLVLVGFMGSGKTTVGKLLSERLSLPFVDLDTVIVERMDMTIPEIFKKKGEKFFREVERQLLAEELKKEKSFVLSTGGGAPTYQNNMEVINSSATSIFLYADFDTLYSRICGDSNRPLTSLNREELMELYKKRLPFYKMAHLTIDTTGKTPIKVTEEIISLLFDEKGKSTQERQENQT